MLNVNNYHNVLLRSRNHQTKTQQIPYHQQTKDFETIVEMRDPISIRDQCQRNVLQKTRIFQATNHYPRQFNMACQKKYFTKCQINQKNCFPLLATMSIIKTDRLASMCQKIHPINNNKSIHQKTHNEVTRLVWAKAQPRHVQLLTATVTGIM